MDTSGTHVKPSQKDDFFIGDIITYTSHRCFPWFVRKLKGKHEQGKKR